MAPIIAPAMTPPLPLPFDSSIRTESNGANEVGAADPTGTGGGKNPGGETGERDGLDGMGDAATGDGDGGESGSTSGTIAGWEGAMSATGCMAGVGAAGICAG
jgi:hypothetical protein